MQKTILFTLISLLTYTATQAATWFDGQHPVNVSIIGAYSPVVNIAAEMFTSDMQAVTGQEANITYSASSKTRKSSSTATIEVYQLDKANAATINALSKLGVLHTKIMDNHDAFSIDLRGNRIIIVGNNGRGAAYGLLEMSRNAGVSPWIWWGDVVPERKPQLSLPDNYNFAQAPSVEYRGIFINDEDFSILLWGDQMDGPTAKYPKTIGPKTNKRIFQLLLRLRANCMWPAMHGASKAFFTVEGNREMADSCGIVIGSSHCEPLLRNNVGEWDKSQRGDYNFITNRKEVEEYWAGRLKEMRGKEGFFTIGMRGIHDGSMEGVKTAEEKLQGLQSVIDCQRNLIRTYYNKDVRHVPQVFIPYKEVLEIYENGLRVPDDVTLMWCDDNYGYMTRLSDSIQQQRSGGAGIYYHLSYWGRPHDHLWLTTTQPGLVYNELRTAYDHGAKKIWIINVHDPKVAAYDLSLAMDMAWNIDSVQHETVRYHLKQWLTNQYGEQTAQNIYPAMVEFYRLCGIRRPEFMGWTQTELDKRRYPRGLSLPQGTSFSETEFGGELERYLEQYDNIEQQVIRAENTLPRPELKASYFAHILYPVRCAAAMAHKHLDAQRGDTLAANEAGTKIHQLTKQYNEMLGGKWNKLMNSHPRDLPVFQDFTVTDSITIRRTPSRPLNEVSLDGCVVRNACHYNKAYGQVQRISMLGHSMNAISISKGATVSYTFYAPRDGNAVIRTALIPTQPNDKGDLRIAVSIDGCTPAVYSLREPFRSEAWKQNVLRAQTIRNSYMYMPKGVHTMTVTALDDHIIFDQWMLDYKPSRKFYVFPAEQM